MPIITSSGCLSHTVTNTNLFYLPIEEIIGNHPDKFTPAGLLDMTSRFDQVMSFTKFNVDKALEI
jgi:hypothetical protein